MLFQAENYVCYTIYDARSPEKSRLIYAARYSTSLNPKLELLWFERWNYCAGAAMFLHTILSLKQIYPTEKGEKEMFEITYSDNDLLENYQECGKGISEKCQRD